MTIVDPERDERGWAITDERGTTPDPVNDFTFLSEGYVISDPAFDGRVTVPVLWDRKHGRIVNNESADIIRMFDLEFAAFAEKPEPVWYPEELRAEIDEINEFVYENVNDGVYRTGFAKTQAAYERAFGKLFDALDELDARLATSRYLVGDRITEADWRLFPTLVRFDAAYVGHFQCNLRRIVDYPNLSGLPARAVPVPGHRRDRRHGSHQAALLPHAPAREPDAHRARRPGARLHRAARARPPELARGGRRRR